MRLPRIASALGLALGLTVLSCSSSAGPTSIEIPIASIQIRSGVCAIPEGATCSLIAEAKTGDGLVVSNPTLRWSSGNPSIATVEVGSNNATATVHARAFGSTKVRVENTTGDAFDEVGVTVLLCSKC